MILSILVSLVAVAGFGIALWKLAIVGIARSAIGAATDGVSSMLDSELDDDQKEVAVRRAGLSLIRSAFDIFWRFAVALAAAAAPIFLADLVGLVSADAVIDLMLSWEYILIVSVLAILVSELLRRRNRSATAQTDEVNRYSTADRFFHMLAFSSPWVLKRASSLEDRVVSGLPADPAARPIFITSLARGGTTALLNAFHDIPGIATHTYRDMPFLTAPVLWNRLTGGSRRTVERHERAHGDGLEIDLNSPEAFEEVVWKLCWPGKYGATGIACWDTPDRDPASEAFLSHHMAKIVHARQGQTPAVPPDGGRYCSKNNANIARIPFLRSAFPDASIVVPVRQPGAHAASLLRQHKNFCSLQEEDPFIRRYMRDIGHFEFGQIFKPLLFPGVRDNAHDPFSGDYWLQYWIDAFDHVAKHADDCIFVLQDDLRADPQDTMDDLCARLGLNTGTMSFAGYFHSKPDNPMSDLFSPALHQKATVLYDRLRAMADRQKARTLELS
ncbi:sulfotransferase [Pseudooceanicola sp. LIPI14-2-Ac024]|uniref:sulfotransferase n=1 Tax=Pseudooceanicola sp. LIPI14-2-Ac024 TaxID=3344875 RepID=UPI0035CFB75C